MVRTGALVLFALTGVLAVAGVAAADPTLDVAPASGVPGSTFVVVPVLDKPAPCQIEWNNAVLNSPTVCGPPTPDPSPVTLTAPTDPGDYTVTLCSPDCGQVGIHLDKTFTVLKPAPTDTSPLGVEPLSLSGSVSQPSKVRDTTTRVTPSVSNPVPSSNPAPSSVPARPVASGSHVPPSLAAAGVAVLVLLALGATLALRRRQPVPHHAGPPRHVVTVSTSARRRAVRTAPRRHDHGRVGLTSRRSRAAQSQHTQRRQEFTRD